MELRRPSHHEASKPMSTSQEWGDGRESNPPPQGHSLPSSQTSTVTKTAFVGRRGLAPRSLGFQPSAITRLAHDPFDVSANATPSGATRSPRPGSNRNLPFTKRVLVLSSYKGNGSSGRNRTFEVTG